MLTQKMEIPIGFFEVGAVMDVEFPFEDKNEEKLRPSVIIKTSEDTAASENKIIQLDYKKEV